MTRRPLLLPRVAALALLAGLVLLSASCKRGPEKKALALKTNFSVNVMPTPSFWPRDRDWDENPEVRGVQEAAWREHGTPDYLWWVHTVNREPIHRAQLEEGRLIPGRRSSILIDWVYLEDEKILSFSGPKVTEHRLTDKIETMCLYGDPNEVRQHQDAVGVKREIWLYYNHGKQVTFIDGQIETTKDFSAMPAYGIRN